MSKKTLVLVVMFIFLGVSQAFAEPPPFNSWKCLVYDGFVSNLRQDASGAVSFLVMEDTGVFVTNPNVNPVKAWIRIFNKNGIEIWSSSLWNTDSMIERIPSMGFGWMSIGWAISQVGYETNGREKFTYQISMSKPRPGDIQPKLKCVVEVKQVIYNRLVPPKHAMLGRYVDLTAVKTYAETAVEHWTPCPGLN